jgi:DnaJ-class molecular chaperone
MIRIKETMTKEDDPYRQMRYLCEKLRESQEPKTCHVCGGSGQGRMLGTGWYGPIYAKCPTCKGSGKVQDA